MEVVEGIHRIETPFGGRVNAVYLFAGSERGLLVDTATDQTGAKYVGQYLDHIGYEAGKVRYVLNTHSDWDHIAGNRAIRELAPDAVVACHELDRPMIEDIERMIADRYCEFAADHGFTESDESKAAIRDGTRTVPIDVGLMGGETLHLGRGWRVEVVHTPGHSWGSISVYDPRSAALVVGDAVLGDAVPFADGRPAFPPTYRYVDSYVSSAKRMQGLAVHALLSSHYPIYDHRAGREFLAVTLGYVDRVETALRRALADGQPRSMRQLARELGPTLGSWPEEASEALAFPFAGHLERLLSHRLIEARPGPEVTLFSWRR